MTMVASNGFLWVYQGWGGTVYYNSVYKLQVDVKVSYTNFYAINTGFAVAGSSSFYTVQIRDSQFLNTSSPSLQSSYKWGNILPWGTGLSFTYSIVGLSNVDGELITSDYSSSDTDHYLDNGDGTYKVGYIPTSSSILSLTVSYSDGLTYNQVPGSPFKVVVNPAAPYPANFLCFGNSTANAIEGSSSYFYVLIRDQYYNPVNASTSGLSANLFSFYANSELIPFTSTIVSNGDWDSSFFSILTKQNVATPSVYRIDFVVPSSSYTLKVKYGSTFASYTPTVVTYKSVEVPESVQSAVLAISIIALIIIVSLFIFLVVYFFLHLITYIV